MTDTSSPESDNGSRLSCIAAGAARKLVPLIYIVSAFAFVSDMERDNSVEYGVIYAPLLGTAVFHQRRSGLWILTSIACIMVVIGAFSPFFSSDRSDLIGNRILSIIAIISTAAFVNHARDTQLRLAAQTRRAEAAERIKADVLQNLSEEIRTPLHTLLGILTLTTATTRPDQREVLTKVRSDGERLLATIDKLNDLSQIQDLPLSRPLLDRRRDNKVERARPPGSRYA